MLPGPRKMMFLDTVPLRKAEKKRLKVSFPFRPRKFMFRDTVPLRKAEKIARPAPLPVRF
jgi:hypothetical protein